MLTFLGEIQRIAFALCYRRVCVCVCVCLCVCRVCRRQKKGLRQRRRFFSNLREITPNIICKNLKQIGLQISRWRTKWRP